MNIIDNLVTRIENRRKETKNPCKSYASYQAADKAAQVMAEKAKQHFGVDEVRYIVFYNPSWGRYHVAFGLNELLAKGVGGYIGIFAEAGFHNF